MAALKLTPLKNKTGIASLLVDPSVQPVFPTPWKGLPVERMPLDDAHILAAMEDGETLAFLVYDTFEFLGAISRRDLLGHAAKLVGQTPWSYILIVGTFTPGSDNTTLRNGVQMDHWKWSSIAGMFDSLNRAGVTVLQVAEENDLPGMIKMLAQRDRKSENRVSPPSPLMFHEPAMDILVALPNIGEDRAQAILKTVSGNVVQALEMLTGPVDELPNGIGPKIRDSVREALGLTNPEFGIKFAPLADGFNYQSLCADLLDEITAACDAQAQLLASMNDPAALRLISWRDRLRAALPVDEPPATTTPIDRDQAKADILALYPEE